MRDGKTRGFAFTARVLPVFLFGGAYGIRTRDLHTASVARSQLRQYPIKSYLNKKIGDPYGNRTHVCGVRGRRLNRLTNGPLW